MVRQTEALIQLRSRLSDRLSGYGDDMVVQTPTLTERGRRIAFGHGGFACSHCHPCKNSDFVHVVWYWDCRVFHVVEHQQLLQVGW